MKKIFSCLLLCLCTAIATNAQKNANVPDAVTNAFNNKFPGATAIKWEKESAKEWEANFKWNNATVSANFGLDGSWVETETTINANELPAAVTGAINTKYPGATFALAEKIEKPGAQVFYEAVIKVKGKKKELELRPDGSFLN